MKDWNLLARAAGLDIPAADLARLETPLSALDAVFRPLTATLEPHMEPSAVFRAAEENQ